MKFSIQCCEIQTTMSWMVVLLIAKGYKTTAAKWRFLSVTLAPGHDNTQRIHWFLPPSPSQINKSHFNFLSFITQTLTKICAVSLWNSKPLYCLSTDPFLAAAEDQKGLDAVLLQIRVPLPSEAWLHLIVAVQVLQCGLCDVDAPVSQGRKGSCFYPFILYLDRHLCMNQLIRTSWFFLILFYHLKVLTTALTFLNTMYSVGKLVQ